ncbi:MAG TPA: neutral zinc metallopeptidase [Gemmatimonadaceae bacterium]|nr:neutral zinc metallopeptidase [Gemmatimonadaceae bacterium]
MSLGLTDELVITLVVSWALLTVVRFVDVNEREPVWALVIAFLLGGVVAAIAHSLLSGPSLALLVWQQAAVAETAKFIALVATVAVFAGVGRLKGFSELSDLTDGIVFGIAVGLGYSAADTMIREFDASRQAMWSLLQTDGGAILYSVLGGLPQGVFGAVIGLGFGAAAGARSKRPRLLLPLLGLGGAIVLDALFFDLKHGDALGGTAGLARAWLAVVLPLVLLVAAGVFSLSVERTVIRRQLAPEIEAGVLNAEDIALLESFWKRQLRYVGLLLNGRVAQCITIAGRHGRLVQLALFKRREERQSGTSAGDAAHLHVKALRESLLRGRAITLVLLLAGAMAIALVVERPALAQASRPPRQRWPSTEALLAVARKDIDGFWSKQLGVLYTSPVFVGPYPAAGACPFQAHNAQYCSSENSIYYDPRFLDEQNHSIGDYAAVWILAHEWGHRVQHLQGKLGSSAGMFSIQIELQADCYAGRYTKDALTRSVLEPGDDELAVTSLRGAHDPVDYPWFEKYAHGTSGQRIDALTEGFEGRDCDGDAFWRRVHVDPHAAAAPAPPVRGPVIGGVACRRGRFERIDMRPAPDFIKGVVTDAISAKFRSADGVVVDLVLEAFSSADAAERFASNAALDGYALTKEGAVKDGETVLGKWKLLSGKSEIMLFQKRQVVNIAEGPRGITWEFMTSAAVFDCKP